MAHMALSNKLFLVNFEGQECLGLQKLGSSLGVTI